MKYISIHALREEGDLLDQFLDSIHISISIHALREEGDDMDYLLGKSDHNFYPRPPRGGRLAYDWLVVLIDLFLSTPSARRATKHCEEGALKYGISIHALREEGDSKNRDKISIFL